jgi:hypothetical protein
MPEHDPALKSAHELTRDTASAATPDPAHPTSVPALSLVPAPAPVAEILPNPEPEFVLTPLEPAPAPSSAPPTSTWDPASSVAPQLPPAPPPVVPKPPPSSWLEVDRDQERQRRAALERQRWTELSQSRRLDYQPDRRQDRRTAPVEVTPEAHLAVLPTPVIERRPVDPLAWWVIAGALVLGAVMYWTATRTTLSGAVVATGPTLGNWTMNVDSCHVNSVGSPQQLTFEDSDHPSLRMQVTSDPHEPPAVQVVSAVDGQMHSVDFDRCGDDRVQTAIPPSSKVLSGTLTLNCAVGLSRLTAQLNFENCR